MITLMMIVMFALFLRFTGILFRAGFRLFGWLIGAMFALPFMVFGFMWRALIPIMLILAMMVGLFSAFRIV